MIRQTCVMWMMANDTHVTNTRMLFQLRTHRHIEFHRITCTMCIVKGAHQSLHDAKLEISLNRGSDALTAAHSIYGKQKRFAIHQQESILSRTVKDISKFSLRIVIA